MAEKKKKKKSPVNDRSAPLDDELLDDELEEEGEELDDEDVDVDAQLTTDEEAVSPDNAEETAGAAEGVNVLTLSSSDLPEAAGLNPGDPINATVELTLKRKDEEADVFEFEVTDVISQQADTELDTQASEGGAPPIPGAAGLLGGAGGLG